MTKRLILIVAVVVGLLTALPLTASGGLADPATVAAGHHPMYMAAVGQAGNPTIQPPPVCCIPAPESITGKLPVPTMGNMAYFGGPIQVKPTIYLVFWGWGEPGAFDHTVRGMPTYDPDGAAARMTSFVKAIGGTHWAGVQTQYYETDASGNNTYITNPSSQFGGVWYDNTTPVHDNLTGLELAQEAQRAVAHFGVTDLANSQFIIAQPQRYNETGFNQQVGYCAWHDNTTVGYPGVTPGIAFTNMPYVLNMGTSCGENSVNSSYAGVLDGFTIVMGHEIEETVTDPGAGETAPDGSSLGGWYDIQGFENGDKCAWAGYTGLEPASTIPDGLQNIKGSDGQLYPIQTLWSNDSAGGVGYCAGGNNDLPTG